MIRVPNAAPVMAAKVIGTKVVTSILTADRKNNASTNTGMACAAFIVPGSLRSSSNHFVPLNKAVVVANDPIPNVSPKSVINPIRNPGTNLRNGLILFRRIDTVYKIAIPINAMINIACKARNTSCSVIINLLIKKVCPST